MNTICIMCPMGCPLEISKNEDGVVKVAGNTCARGKEYGVQEFAEPKRIVTTLIQNTEYVFSLKTDKPVPKNMVNDVLKEIKRVHAKNLYTMGSAVITNVLSTGADVVVTGISQKRNNIFFK